MNLEELKKNLQKAAKGTHIELLEDSNIANHFENIATPSYDLNRIISGSLFKGILDKTLTLIVGPEHSFKSSYIAICLAIAQKMGYTPVLIDSEGGFSKEFAERWGIDTNNFLYIYEPVIDKALLVLNSLLESAEEEGKNYAIGTDSIGGFFRQKIHDDANKGDVKADQGKLQQDIKVYMKLLLKIIKSRNSVGFCAGHLYGNPNAYGGADEIGGGKSVRLAPDYIISLKKTPLREGEAKSSKVIGNQITAITLKNRFYPPFQEATILIDYINGIDPMAGMLDLLIAADIVQKGGSWFSYGDTKLGQGAIKAMNFVKENNEKLKILEKLDEWLLKTGYSNINKDVEIEVKESVETKKSKEGENDGKK